MNLFSILIALGLVAVGYACNCGWINKGRIVNGKEAPKNAYPLIATLEWRRGGQFCGGSILTTRHVLTAAHCTIDETPWTMRIKIGAHDLRTAQGTIYDVQQIINHERYVEKSYLNDIAIVVTKTRMAFNQNAGPVCLPTGRLNIVGQKLKALGWGKIQHKGKDSDVLREVDLTVVSYKQCEASWRSSPEDHPTAEHSLCTYEGSKDTCQGDSGGPLVWLNPKTRRLTLAALVSFGGVCGGSLPAVNSDVGSFIPWIRSKIASSVPGEEACFKG